MENINEALGLIARAKEVLKNHGAIEINNEQIVADAISLLNDAEDALAEH